MGQGLTKWNVTECNKNFVNLLKDLILNVSFISVDISENCQDCQFFGLRPKNVDLSSFAIVEECKTSDIHCIFKVTVPKNLPVVSMQYC